MRLFLLFLSSLFSLISFSVRADELDSVNKQSPLCRYAFQIDTPNGFVSGIMLVSENDENITGSMINEFGVSAIDFSYSREKQKVKLLSVVNFLNKWYIKRVLKNDIKFCLHVLFEIPYQTKHPYEIIKKADCVEILNTKRHLKYSFSPLTNSTNNTDDTEE